jgi:hypothetical protein
MHLMNDRFKTYSDEEILRVMQIIRSNGNLLYIETEDFKLTRIVEIFDLLKQNKYICSGKNSEVHLSEEGEQVFQQLCRKSGLRGLYKYIIQNPTKRKQPIKITDIYIPTR